MVNRDGKPNYNWEIYSGTDTIAVTENCRTLILFQLNNKRRREYLLLLIVYQFLTCPL